MRVATEVKRSVRYRRDDLVPYFDGVGRMDVGALMMRAAPVDVGEVSLTVDVDVAHVEEALRVLERAYRQARSELESVTYTPPPQDEVKP